MRPLRCLSHRDFPHGARADELRLRRHFEDVMELCDVHANLLKMLVKGVEVEDTEHPGHPVRVFKEEICPPCGLDSHSEIVGYL